MRIGTFVWQGPQRRARRQRSTPLALTVVDFSTIATVAFTGRRCDARGTAESAR